MWNDFSVLIGSFSFRTSLHIWFNSVPSFVKFFFFFFEDYFLKSIGLSPSPMRWSVPRAGTALVSPQLHAPGLVGGSKEPLTLTVPWHTCLFVIYICSLVCIDVKFSTLFTKFCSGYRAWEKCYNSWVIQIEFSF